MTFRPGLFAGFLTVAVIAISPFTASAALITFTHIGNSGSGSVGDIPFTDRPFTITATGDTLNRGTISPTIFDIDHDLASISIDGVGVFNFLSPTRTFFNDNVDSAGFSRAGVVDADLYNGPGSAPLNGWDMLSSIGPVGGVTLLLQWSQNPVIQTTGGQLIFNDAEITGSFQAVVGIVPEPAPATLCLLSVAGLMLRRRRMA